MQWYIAVGIFCFSVLCMVNADINIPFQEMHVGNKLLETSCDEFFFGPVFPQPLGDLSGLVKLCQTQQHGDYIGPAIYATLYNITARIPVYSAGVLAIYPNSTGFSRPEENFWRRVSLGLCDVDKSDIPVYPISSRIASAEEQLFEKCIHTQAVNRDYDGNWKILGVERGHLNPNAINFQDKERQIGTFTLTNAAPQFSQFNQITWEEYECMVKYVIFHNAPMERVYIITGTLGVANDPEGNPLWMNDGAGEGKNPVKVPGYYWKAVCYPGSPWTGALPWSFVIMQQNTRGGGYSGPGNFMSVRQFSGKYFRTNLFHERCMNAPMGPIVSFFENWTSNVDKHCRRVTVKTSNLRWGREEL